MHRVTCGLINPGLPRKDRERQELLGHIRQPFVEDFRIAFLSIKDEVGKTTSTMDLASALAMVRSDRVIAVGANPDRGTLAEQVLDARRRRVREQLGVAITDRPAKTSATAAAWA